jgi:hypothetical protein
VATFNHIGGQEPSTVSFKVATVTQTRNSSVMHQEILSIGDPDSSAAIAAVVNTAPGSTAWGVVVRDVATRYNIGSTAADNAVLMSGNSTVVQGTNPWVVSPNSTAWVKNAGLSVDSSNALNVKLDGSTAITIGSIAVGAGRLNIGSTAADNAVLVSGNSTVVIASGNSSVIITSGNSSVTISAISASAGRLNIGSTAADNAVLISGNSTVVQGTSPWVVAEVMQSSGAPSSASSGVIVRTVIDNILTVQSSNGFGASTSFTVQSSAAGIRSYVTAYSILSTNAGPTKVKFYSGSTLLWPMIFAAVSSAVSGANLAASAPAYLFRTKSAGPLTLQIGSGASAVAGWQVAVSYFRAP